MKKSIAVLGLGEYGRSLSENLYKMGADVLAVVAAYMAAMALFGMNAYEKNLIFGMVKKVFRRPSRKKA